MPLLKFSLKTKQLLNTQKKYFFIDNLFINLADIEDRLENTIFLYLVRRYGQRQLYFGRDDRRHEIDFIVLEKDGKISAIQVCYQLNDSNFNRETRSFLRFREINKDKEISANLIYMHDARTVQNSFSDIKIQNIAEFLLSP